MAQISIGYGVFEPSKNLMGLSNVTLHSSVKQQSDSLQTNLAVYTALKPIVTLHPDWKFVGMGVYNGQVVCTFLVRKDDEELGNVSIEYKGRNLKLAVSNHRIKQSLHRGDAKHTEDPAVAEKLIRKFFYPKLVDEHVSTATAEMGSILAQEGWAKTRELNKAASSLFGKAGEFVERNIDQYIAEFPQEAKHLPVYQKAKLNMQTVTDIKEAFDKGKCVLVILDGLEYIVRSGDETKVYNNDTLPEELRAKIGMLKLVEPGQMISGVGCKGSTTTMAIVVGVDVRS